LYAYLVRPDAISVWGHREVRERLSWYHDVMNKYKPPKYLIAKKVDVGIDPGEVDGMGLGDLLRIHSKYKRVFLDLLSKVRDGGLDIGEVSGPKYSLLDLKRDIIFKMLDPCILCEHKCRARRLNGGRGFCGLDSTVRVSSAFLHLGEEAPLVPSGTIFFSGCSFRCVFCQNWDISSNPFNGEVVDGESLAKIAIGLASRGARNINYVGGNPDQQLHVIMDSLRYMNINIPILWNSNLYISREALDILIDVVDIWLPDFKYGNNDCAYKYSRIRNYFDIVSRNHKIIYEYGSDIIIRHLVMPNHLECCTKPILEWISVNTPKVLVNVMDQYRPEHRVLREPDRFREISRRLTSREISEAYSLAEKLGICYKYVS